MKALKIIIVILFVLAASVMVFYQVFFRLPLPDYSGTAEIKGLETDVEVRFDKYGVPHIFAGNDKDLFFAQGYITARERMFQMDLTRRAGRGELSAMFGDMFIKTDKFLKTAGFYRTAVIEYRELPQEHKDIIIAYTRGVNEYISTVKSLPREYLLLGIEPEKWVPEDSIVCMVLMAYNLTRSKKTDLILYSIAESAGKDILKYISPYLPDFAPDISMLKNNKFPARKYKSIFTRFSPVRPDKTGEPDISVLSEIAASNWMIFSGSKTDTGKPIFTGSPDLEPKIPSLFYLVHLKSGNYDVIGGSIPGVLGINVLGFNGRIAWSCTNGRVDELDYFIEKINPDNPNQYLTENGYRDFDIVEETLKIKTKEGIREEKFTVKISRHGPIISDVMSLTPKNTAMMWVGSKPTGVFKCFTKLMKAGNFDEFRSAIKNAKTPSLNMGYADADGNIGYQYMASPPVRKKGNGILPVPGWTGEYDWSGYIPFEKLPYDLNPAKGYVASFNNPPRKTSYHMTSFYMFERAMRFEEIVKDLDKVDLKKAKKFQIDAVSVIAKRWVPYILKACSNKEELSGVLDLFDGWDFSLKIDSPAATLFSSFYFHMMGNTLKDNVGEEAWKDQLSQYYIIYIPDLVLTKIIGDNGHFLYDNTKTADKKETRNDIIIQSMKDAIEELTARLGDNPEDWQWGKIHRMTFMHPLGKKISLFNLDPIPTNGDGFTINAGLWDNKNPYDMKSGGVIRMIVDFSNLKNSTIVCPPGQSGHYISPHYDDIAEMWAGGGQIPLNYLSGKELPNVLILKKK